MLRIHSKFNVLRLIPICLITWIIVALFEQRSQLPLKKPLTAVVEISSPSFNL